MSTPTRLFCPRCATEDALAIAGTEEDYSGRDSTHYAVAYSSQGGEVVCTRSETDRDTYPELADRGSGTLLDLEIRCSSCSLCASSCQARDGLRYLTHPWPAWFRGPHVAGVPVGRLATAASYAAWVAEQAGAGEREPPRERWGLGRVAEIAPGYAGFKKRKLERERDAQYGAGRWHVGHLLGEAILTREEALALYDVAYLRFLKESPAVLDWICASASDVYDYAPANTRCGVSYDMTGERASHYQDVAVRRAVAALGRRFEGEGMVQIRGRESAGHRLNPGRVPFHLPRFIRQPEGCAGADQPCVWWDRGSIESFWQNNKVLLVKDG